MAEALPSPLAGDSPCAGAAGKRRTSGASLSPDESRLLDELRRRRRDRRSTSWPRRTGLSVSGLLALLLGLELKGAVVQLPGKEFQRRM
ncbi:MAG: hypothetical protein MZU91_07875 [Desulfosudis oleivorans]|nr:hypothetical protein [Desulfosudis oleivorans]